MIYEDCKIYGPYSRKDGRQHIIDIFPDGTRKTVSYPKFLKEKEINRYLEDEETVDHIDGNFENNALSNLQILSRSEHVTLDVKRYKKQEFTCPMCDINFELEKRKLHAAIHNRRKGKAGPFCGRSCAGKYGAEVQNGKMSKLKIKKVTPEYTTNKDK